MHLALSMRARMDFQAPPSLRAERWLGWEEEAVKEEGTVGKAVVALVRVAEGWVVGEKAVVDYFVQVRMSRSMMIGRA